MQSHAQRKIGWLERQLARDDLNVNLRNMYRGWNRRIEGETQSKLEEINKRSGVLSSLEIIGAAVVYPEASSSNIGF